MRALVVLAVLGFCSAFPFIPDDPDVAAEKARFFRTFKIIEGASKIRAGGGYAAGPGIPYAVPRPQPKWWGPLASKIPASLPGSSAVVQNTPEVQNARSQFFNTYNSQVVATKPSPGSRPYYYSKPASAPAPVAYPTYSSGAPQEKWTGPLASAVPASVPGSSPVVFDTPEVSNAKAAFFNAYNHQVKTIMPRPSYF